MKVNFYLRDTHLEGEFSKKKAARHINAYFTFRGDRLRLTTKLQVKHDPFYVEYSDREKGLIIADPNTIKETFDSRNQKAALDETIEIIAAFLGEPAPKSELIEKLCLELNCKERTIETRLKSIITHKLAIPDANGVARNLCKRQEGKEVIYFLSE